MTTSAIVEIGEVVSWLKSIEEWVERLYTRSAKAFVRDKEFSGFLNQLADDEKLHAKFMSMISDDLVKTKRQVLLDVVLDEKTINNVEEPLKKFGNLLVRKSISKKQIVEYMARAETSELNPVFLYIVGTFKEMNREAEGITAEIQSHLLRIQSFIGTLPKELKPSINLDTFNSIWENRFLIVDDNEPLRKLVASLLSNRGTVEVTAGGNEGMEKVRKHFYNGIVSDIEMPSMDGFEFYKRAVEYDSRLKKHFVFYSADITPEREAYLKKNNLWFLRKPFGLSEFQEIMDKILL